jgi:hypothetical protein
MREARRGLLVLAFTGLMAAGLLAATTAWGVEPEVPLWNVAGTRLASGSKPASIANVVGVKAALRSHIETTEIEIRCESEALHEAAIEGSEAKHAGKASGVLELAECKLFIKEGEAFVEDRECTVPAIKSVPLNGSLWLEGKKGEGDTTVVLFEPKESPLAKITIGGCALEGSYALTGDFAARLLPQDEEFEYIQWVQSPQAVIEKVWRPTGEAGEKTVGLELEGNPATLQGEVKVELGSHELFGGGTEPVAGIEAPFWGLEHKRLNVQEEEELKEAEVPRPPSAEPTKLSWKLKGTEVETKCGKTTYNGPRVIGSFSQHDGRFAVKAIKLSECTFFAKEKGGFVEQKACQVPTISFNALSGKMWLLGFSSARGTTPVLVLVPENLTGGKAVLGTVAVLNRGSEKCPYLEESYAVEGGLITHMIPENVEAKALELSITESAGHVYQPAEQQAEKQVVVSHGSERVFISMPNVPLQPKSGKQLGGGSTGIGENPFTSTNGKPTGAFKSGVVILEGGGATLECSSSEGTSTILSGGKAATKGNSLSSDIEKWNGCKASTKEIKEAKPKVKACTLRLTKTTGETKARGSVATECTVETTVLFITCVIHVSVEKEAEKVNFGLEKNALENSGANLLIKAEDSGITTTISGTCPGVSANKENKLKATTTSEGVNEA